MKRTLSTAALLVGLASSAGAQIIRQVRVDRPSAYTSLSVGWLTQQVICDPATAACWNFRDAAQYRASIEVPISSITTFGFSYSNARLPLLWGDSSSSASCSLCEANAEMHTFLGVLHMGSTGAFTQIIDVSAGATRFANFKTTAGAPLGSGKSSTDFTFAIGYGMGIRLATSLYFTLQEDYGIVFHERMPGSQSGAAQQRALRGGLRYGF